MDIVIQNDDSDSFRHAIAIGVAGDFQPIVVSANLESGEKRRRNDAIPHLGYEHEAEFTMMLNSTIVATETRIVPFDLDTFTVKVTDPETVEILPLM